MAEVDPVQMAARVAVAQAAARLLRGTARQQRSLALVVRWAAQIAREDASREGLTKLHRQMARE